jgi:hypothetical protein
MGKGEIPLKELLLTAELARRPARLPDYAAENHALTEVAEAAVQSPQAIHQKLAEVALALCRADSAGVSILEPGGRAGIFRWRAVAGQLAPDAGRQIPREATPCGTVLDQNAPLLFAYPSRRFDYGAGIHTPIVEALHVPFNAGEKARGTLWVIAHTPSRRFDPNRRCWEVSHVSQAQCGR